MYFLHTECAVFFHIHFEFLGRDSSYLAERHPVISAQTEALETYQALQGKVQRKEAFSSEQNIIHHRKPSQAVCS